MADLFEAQCRAILDEKNKHRGNKRKSLYLKLKKWLKNVYKP